MSTSATYKNAALTSIVGGGQATLETAGTWLEDDITLTDTFNWMGDGWELWKERFYQQEVALEDTDFATWTPSTTAQVIQAYANVGTFSADMANYEYMLRWRWYYDIAQSAGATLKATVDRQFGCIYQQLHRRANSLTNISTMTDSYNYCTTMFSGSSYIIYWNTSGTLTFNVGQSYGFYAAAQAATFSSGTSNTPTVTVRRPPISARCSATYFATARAPEVDQENSFCRLVCDIYRIKRTTGAVRNMYRDAMEMYNTPLTIVT